MVNQLAVHHDTSWRDWDSISKCSVGQHWFGGLRWFGWTSSKILHGSATFYHDSAGDFKRGSLQWICFLLFWICSWTLGFVLPASCLVTKLQAGASSPPHGALIVATAWCPEFGPFDLSQYLEYWAVATLIDVCKTLHVSKPLEICI